MMIEVDLRTFTHFMSSYKRAVKIEIPHGSTVYHYYDLLSGVVIGEAHVEFDIYLLSSSVYNPKPTPKLVDDYDFSDI